MSLVQQEHRSAGQDLVESCFHYCAQWTGPKCTSSGIEGSSRNCSVVTGPRFAGGAHDASAQTTCFDGVSSSACKVPTRSSSVVLHSFTQLLTTVSPFSNRQACCRIENLLSGTSDGANVH